ncbi:MAG TPA: hypothetical protein DCE11_05025 [Ruminiclostridium sp.]|jgi:Na+-transporting methylmalonyl-CoA/oxaloacetate decarboxylase gamma subunit|nr:hypothetical protein [Clostridiaceae bacterium]HAA25468.1 hypothetical protein [Ruminiclostridium sp.]
MDDVVLGMQLMQYGLSGVFLVLILFYGVITLLMKALPYRAEDDENKQSQ